MVEAGPTWGWVYDTLSQAGVEMVLPNLPSSLSHGSLHAEFFLGLLKVTKVHILLRRRQGLFQKTVSS